MSRFAVLCLGDITLETSGRQAARAPRGFSNLLRALADRRGCGEAAPPSAAMRPDPAFDLRGAEGIRTPDPSMPWRGQPSPGMSRRVRI